MRAPQLHRSGSASKIFLIKRAHVLRAQVFVRFVFHGMCFEGGLVCRLPRVDPLIVFGEMDQQRCFDVCDIAGVRLIPNAAGAIGGGLEVSGCEAFISLPPSRSATYNQRK
jgi:hypothetical protein